MGSAPDLFFGQRGEPALDPVKPRSGCWPSRRDSPVLIAHHQMHIQFRWGISLDRTQQLQEPGAAMAPVQMPDDLSSAHIQGCEQRPAATAFVTYAYGVRL